MTIEIFKQIKLGGKGKDELIRELVDLGVQFNKYANVLFEDEFFVSSDESRLVEVVKVNQADLGLDAPSTFENICAKAEEFGLSLCPLVLGVYLRPLYFEQPEGPYLTIASKKTRVDDEYPNGFYLRNIEGHFWLRGYRASADYEWPLEHEFVFKKS